MTTFARGTHRYARAISTAPPATNSDSRIESASHGIGPEVERGPRDLLQVEREAEREADERGGPRAAADQAEERERDADERERPDARTGKPEVVDQPADDRDDDRGPQRHQRTRIVLGHQISLGT